MASLPVDSVLPALLEALVQRHELVLEAPPGAGKTTRVPLALLDQDWLGGDRIIMLEPRRLATRAAATYMAGLLGQKVGDTVGYRMRMDTKVSPATRIEVVTDGILIRMLEKDPSLQGVGVVIFDEFHERNLDSDLALALTDYGRRLFRDGEALRLIVMSATLDGAAVAEHLNQAPIVSSEGRAYPVDVVFADRTPKAEQLEQAVAKTVHQALQQQSGSILVFLPGQAEIRRLERQLTQDLTDPNVQIRVLYGDLDFVKQQAAIRPAGESIRKVVLATTIAESSLTIEGVRVVIDSGLTRVPRFDPRTAMTRLHTERVSRASAEQRKGRAGRSESGVCYRLWSEGEQRKLKAYADPEISQADLAPLALSLFQFGVNHYDELNWLSSPPPAAWQQALDLLMELGALETAKAADVNTPADIKATLRLGARGRDMSALPVHPRLAHMLVFGTEMGLRESACLVAALLSSRDVLPSSGADLLPRVRCVVDQKPSAADSAAVKDARRLQQRFTKLCDRLPAGQETRVKRPSDERWIACLLAFAYPDRIARLQNREQGTYLLANGRIARLFPDDALSQPDWLIVAEVGGRTNQNSDIIFRACELDPSLFDDALAGLIETRTVVEWPQHRDQMTVERQRCIGRLVLSSRSADDIDPAVRQQVAIEYVRKAGVASLKWTTELHALRARIAFSGRCLARANQEQDHDWPDLSDAGLTAMLDDWLGPWLTDVSHVNHLSRLDLSGAIKARLSWHQMQNVDRLAPTHYRVPSGSEYRIDYSQEPPVLAVKLQELFGLEQTPSIGDGVTLQLHLLSPAGRPVQVTQDLKNFWRGSYAEVAKEMRGRYPKHPWPEDPLAASPTRHTRRRSESQNK